MSIFDFIRKKQRNTASVAKERLQIIISHERIKRGQDFIPLLEKELLMVISKYVNIDPEQVKVNLSQQDEYSILELNVTLPEVPSSKAHAKDAIAEEI